MTVIKFTEGNSNVVVKPGINGTVNRVFNATLKYSTKENLPATMGRDEMIFTIDTNELFRGGSELVPLNTVLMYDSFNSFPSKGIDAKVYLDKTSTLMFIWADEQYKPIGGGGGDIIIAPEDARVGNLDDLNTTDKSSVVLAINEVFNSLALIDMSLIRSEIDNLGIDVADIRGAIAAIDASAITDLATKVGNLDDLTTTSKNSIIEAINEVRASVGAGGQVSPGPEVDLTQVTAMIGLLSSLKTTDKTNVIAAVNEIFTTSNLNEIAIRSLNGLVSSIQGNITVSEGRITSNTASIAVIENHVSVLRSDVDTINASINQVNTTIGAISDLTVTDKTSIVSAINELVVSIDGLGPSAVTPAQLLALENSLRDSIGNLSLLSTSQRQSLVLAINELVGRITGLENIQQEVISLRNEVTQQVGNITNLGSLATEASNKASALEGRVQTSENSISSLNTSVSTVISRVATVESSAQEIPVLEQRITNLESELQALKNSINTGTPPTDPKPTVPPTITPGIGDPETIIWEQDFILPTGSFQYDMKQDPTATGKVMIEDDYYLDPLPYKVFSLGSLYEPTEPILVPHVAETHIPVPSEHGRWDAASMTDIWFDIAIMGDWRFKLVRYVPQ